jgi:hypothetical protein
MSTKLVREEIAKFLKRDSPEALCIRGKWGVGKTYAWAKGLEAAQTSNAVALKHYSYVSLFGINSLDDLKFAIFENVTSLEGGVKKADLSTLEDYVSKIRDWRRIARIAQSVPLIKKWIGGEAPGLVAFMTVRNSIVCIDDLERKGKGLDVNDVLGLISYLCEQRDCKVVLILNDEKLEDEGKRSFESQLEKVVGASLVYEPTPEEAAAIGFPGREELNELMAERCTALGITNIRVMKRAARFAQELKTLLQRYDPQVLRVALGSVILFCWTNDQPEEAPSIEFLKSKKIGSFGFKGNEALPQKEAAWNALLEAYGYTWTDDFDLDLLASVKRGYFDPDAIKKHAVPLNEKVLASKADDSFERAWRKYHDSFEDNKDDVLDGLYTSFMNNFAYITPTNLNGTVTLFKELGRADQANEMLNHYMSHRNEPREFYDLNQDPFESVTDPDVRTAFERKFAQTEEKRDIRTMLNGLGKGWQDEDLIALASLPPQVYRKVFKETSGEELRRILSGVFQFDRIANASPSMREITRRARIALKEIGGESDINRRRVRRFGITFDDPAPVARPEKAALNGPQEAS